MDSEESKLILALEKITNLSYTEIRPVIEKYQVDRQTGVWKLCATERDWEVARAVLGLVQKISEKALKGDEK